MNAIEVSGFDMNHRWGADGLSGQHFVPLSRIREIWIAYRQHQWLQVDRELWPLSPTKLLYAITLHRTTPHALVDAAPLALFDEQQSYELQALINGTTEDFCIITSSKAGILFSQFPCSPWRRADGRHLLSDFPVLCQIMNPDGYDKMGFHQCHLGSVGFSAQSFTLECQVKLIEVTEEGHLI